ncbi:MAG: amidase [Roseobacter sp.]
MTRRLQEWNRHINAFVALSDTPAQAGPLNGIEVGVKDIIDVAGLPTKNGSLACHNSPPADQDAQVVNRLREAGARVVGKTTTTEFAFTDPTSCRNPHNLARSPGGSSSGSGAAVAAGIVDIALGTQTAGSLIRPSAYCGVVGFKPTRDLLSLNGVTPLARSFDTVGIIGQDVSLVHMAFEVMAPLKPFSMALQFNALCGLWDTGVDICPEWLQAFDSACISLEDHSSAVTRQSLPVELDQVVAAHRTVMCAEAFTHHKSLLDIDHAPMLQPKFRAGLEAGRKVSPEDLNAAYHFLAQATKKFWGAMSHTELMLTLPVPDGAPLHDGTTGFQDWLTPWTVFGGPLICLPWGLDALSRPRSVMLAAHPGQDQFLLALASQLERCAPKIPKPKLPC